MLFREAARLANTRGETLLVMGTKARLGVSLLLLAIALYVFDVNALLAAVSGVKLSSLIVAVALMQLSFVVAASRWRSIVGNEISLPFLEHLRIYFWSLFCNSFTPANLGGDVYRISVLQARAKLGAPPIVSGVLKERFCGLFGFFSAYTACILACMVMTGSLHCDTDPIFLVALAAVLAGILAIRYSHDVLDLLGRLPWLRSHSLFKRIGTILIRGTLFDPERNVPTANLLLHSFLGVGLWLVASLWIASDFDLGLPLLMVAAITLLTELARFLPISVQGIGVREGTFAGLVGLAEGSAEAGFVAAATIYLAFSAVLVLSGLIAILIRPVSHERAARAADPADVIQSNEVAR